MRTELDKKQIEDSLNVIVEDLNKVKAIISVLEENKQLDELIFEVSMLSDHLYGRNLEKYYRYPESASVDTEEDRQELFLLWGLGTDRRLQDFIDDIVKKAKGETRYVLFLLNKSAIGLRRVLYTHSDLTPVQYALTNASKCLDAITSDTGGLTPTYVSNFEDLLKLANREYLHASLHYETIEEEILSKLDSFSSGLKGDLLYKLEGEDKERLQYCLGLVREVSLFLQAVLSK